MIGAPQGPSKDVAPDGVIEQGSICLDPKRLHHLVLVKRDASQFPSHPGKEAGRMRVQRFRFFCKSLALLSVIGTGFHRTCCKS
jgi:hypothetical protein